MTLDEAKVLFPEQDFVNDFVGYIYVTFNVDEGLFYIGKQTRKDWCDSYYGGGKFPKQWLKKGMKLEHWPIQWCFTKEEINQAEFNWIDKFKNHKDIRNITVGGKGTFTPINDFAKQIRSETFKGENNPMYGKPKSEETKKKISDTKKEYFKTHDGTWKGRHHTEESKQKLKQRAKERELNPNYIHWNCRKVRCIETGKIFKSVTDAIRSLGKKGGHIRDVCNGKREKALGYHWEWVKDK